MFRKPLAWSACGLAAAIVLAVTIWVPSSWSSQAQAAMILSKLNAQMATQPLLDITIEGIDTEDAAVSGHIQVSANAVAGDMRVSAGDPGERVELDVSLAVTEGRAWVMVRKLEIPHPHARALLSMFLIPDQETLLLLPDEFTAEGFGTELAGALEKFRSGELVKMAKVFQELTATREETGASVVNQPDGTLLLTLPLDNEQAVTAMAEILSQFDHLEVSAEMGQEEPADDEDDANSPSPFQVHIAKAKELHDKMAGHHDAAKLRGATIAVIYDPALEQVRSVSLSDLGRTQGRVTVELRDGAIDPSWLDAARVTTPNTRTLDLATLAEFFGGAAGQMVEDLDD